jgi:hypothetical protein
MKKKEKKVKEYRNDIEEKKKENTDKERKLYQKNFKK